jgi:hypothetical protein
MPSLRDRFEAKVDRSGDHHLWLGAKRSDGTGKLTVEGKAVTAQRVAWELTNGPLPPGTAVLACPVVKRCVRVEHLSVRGASGADAASPRRKPRSSAGSGSKVEVRPGVRKLTVSAGRFDDGSVRRLHRTVRADGNAEAIRALAEFATEVDSSPLPEKRADRDITVDEAIERFLTEHLLEEKGRDPRTIGNYRGVHVRWFSPEIGARRVLDIDEAAIDRIFGRMRGWSECVPPARRPQLVPAVLSLGQAARDHPPESDDRLRVANQQPCPVLPTEARLPNCLKRRSPGSGCPPIVSAKFGSSFAVGGYSHADGGRARLATILPCATVSREWGRGFWGARSVRPAEMVGHPDRRLRRARDDEHRRGKSVTKHRRAGGTAALRRRGSGRGTRIGVN